MTPPIFPSTRNAVSGDHVSPPSSAYRCSGNASEEKPHRRRLRDYRDPHAREDLHRTRADRRVNHNGSESTATEFTRKAGRPQTGIHAVYVSVVIPVAVSPDFAPQPTELTGEVGRPGPDVHPVGIPVQIGVAVVCVLHQDRRGIDSESIEA